MSSPNDFVSTRFGLTMDLFKKKKNEKSASGAFLFSFFFIFYFALFAIYHDFS